MIDSNIPALGTAKCGIPRNRTFVTEQSTTEVESAQVGVFFASLLFFCDRLQAKWQVHTNHHCHMPRCEALGDKHGQADKLCKAVHLPKAAESQLLAFCTDSAGAKGLN